MAGSLINRVVRVLEVLAGEGGGLGITSVADRLAMPKSACHRLLAELARLGYVRQDAETARYHLTTKLLSLGFSHLKVGGLVDIAQPILEELARGCSELARLAIVDGGQLTWVAKAQGARSGLRYDADMGQDVPLSCTATGQAWLASFDDDTALAIASKQGFGRLDEYGPNAPRTIAAFLGRLRAARRQGFAYVIDSASVGTSALAAVVRHSDAERVIGTVNITGPSARLDARRLLELAPRVLAAADELSQASVGSEILSGAGSAFAKAARRTVR